MLYSEWLDQDLVGWIQINLLSQSISWLLGFGANHSILFFVQYWHHHIETRQIQYHFLLCRTLVKLVHKNRAGKSFPADCCSNQFARGRVWTHISTTPSQRATNRATPACSNEKLYKKKKLQLQALVNLSTVSEQKRDKMKIKD